MKTTKRALFSSVMALILCFSMLVGTTFAWFTDEVKSGTNTIVAGNLDVELYNTIGVDSSKKVSAETKLFDEIIYWEPGMVAYENLTVANEGTLALKYQLAINFTEATTNVNGDTLAKVLNVGVVPGGVQTNDRQAALDEVTEWLPLASFVKAGELAADESTTYGIVIYWAPSDIDNEFNMNNGQTGKMSINLGVNLFATQLDAEIESDSFGPDYDKDAWHADFVVTTAAELATAIENVKDGGVIALANDLTFDANSVYDLNGYYEGLYYEGDKSITIDLNGNAITDDGTVNDYLLLFKNCGEKANTITIKNGTIEAASSAYCAICTSGGSTQTITMNLENVNVIGNNSNGAVVKVRAGTVLNVNSGTVITGKDSYLGIENVKSTTNIYDGAEIYMNGTTSYNGCLVGTCYGGTVNVYGGYGKGVKGGFIAMTSGGTINVYGGEWIANTDGTYANSNASVLIAQSNKTYQESVGNSIVNVTGGTFKGGYNCYGDADGDAQMNISGGTYNADPSAYVADGYTVIANTDGTYTVQLSQESFDAMIAAGGTVNVPAGKFTLSGDNEVVIVGSGADTVIDITGTINNVNISNATVTGLNYLGAQADDSITFTNVVFDGQFGHVDQGVIYGDAKFVGCTFNGGLHIDKSGADSEIVFEDCTFTELCYIKLSASAHYKFDGCVIEALNTKKVTSPWGRQWVVSYGDVTMTNCQIGRTIRAGGAIDVSLNNCVDADGAALTSTAVATNNSPFVIIDGVYYVKSTAILQAVLDRATTGTTIQLVENVAYGAVEIRPTATNKTTMVCETHSYRTTNAAEFKAHVDDGSWHTTPDYTTTVKDITIIGAEGATVAGLTAISGHIYGDVYDYVRGKDYDAGSAYYCTLNISNLAIKNVAFTGQVNLNTSDADSVYDGVTFEGCSFTTGGTTSDYDAAIRYYNEANNGNVKNITVTGCNFTNCYQGVYVHHVNGITVSGCTFDTIGHNAIALQNHDGAVNLKNVVITGNTFNKVTDRVIRFNQVGADSNITIQNNTATNSGNTSGQIMKAESIASGVVTNISGNTWSGTVVNTELQDK